MSRSAMRQYRRRHTSSNDGPAFKKEGQSEHGFFGETSSGPFFKPAGSATPTVQRKCAGCEKEDKKKVQRKEDKKEEEKLQRVTDKKEEDKKLQRAPEQKEEDKKIQKKESSSVADSSHGGSSFISSLNGRGNALPQNTRQFFATRMGYDFSGVRIHTGKEAEDSARAVNAKAYTIGGNVVFNKGQYNPETDEGKKLLAHELTHVMQQSGADRVSRAVETEDKERESAVPTFSSREMVYQNTRDYANCEGVSVEGHTDANYGNSYTAPGTSTPGGNCAECSPDDCVTNTGTVVSVFTANPQITLPAVPGGLNQCEQRAVQTFINTTLRAHEQQHVAAFNTYRGVVRTPYTYRGCSGGLDAYTQQVHDNVESARKARSDAASAALDANGANIFNVTCNCPDPKADAGSD